MPEQWDGLALAPYLPVQLSGVVLCKIGLLKHSPVKQPPETDINGGFGPINLLRLWAQAHQAIRIGAFTPDRLHTTARSGRGFWEALKLVAVLSSLGQTSDRLAWLEERYTHYHHHLCQPGHLRLLRTAR